MYLLDTNAISETVKKQPNRGFMEWFNSVSQEQLSISCLVIGELQKGASLISEAAQRQRLDAFINGIIDAFKQSTIDVDTSTARLWGNLTALAQKSGQTPTMVDSLISAQCIQNKLVLVTRNSKDFAQFKGLEVLNPWS